VPVDVKAAAGATHTAFQQRLLGLTLLLRRQLCQDLLMLLLQSLLLEKLHQCRLLGLCLLCLRLLPLLLLLLLLQLLDQSLLLYSCLQLPVLRVALELLL
jgi:hypothetical protein